MNVSGVLILNCIFHSGPGLISIEIPNMQMYVRSLGKKM